MVGRLPAEVARGTGAALTGGSTVQAAVRTAANPWQQALVTRVRDGENGKENMGVAALGDVRPTGKGGMQRSRQSEPRTTLPVPRRGDAYPTGHGLVGLRMAATFLGDRNT